MHRRLAGFVLAALIASAVPALAGETNVYGDPGSGNYSVAMAVAADGTGTVFTLGVFLGEFQGVSSTGWDIWMARVGPSGGFDWLVTWDAPEIDDIDFSQESMGSPAWTNPGAELIVGADNRLIGTVTMPEGMSVVGAAKDGQNPTHKMLLANLNRAMLVSDGATGLIGWGNNLGVSGVTRVDTGGVEEWFTPIGDGTPGPLLVLADGTVIAGVSLDRLGFQKPAVKVVGLTNDGAVAWETEIFDACFQSGNPLVPLGGDVGVLLEPPLIPYPSLCDVDAEMVATLDAVSGVRTAQRTLKDTLNIIWCEDPRLAPASDAFGFGFVDGDECGGGDVFWTDVNNTLLDTGSEIEAFSIMSMQIVGQGTFGYGILRTVVDGGRWVLAQFEYLAPAAGLMPYDMVLTADGPVVVGRVADTAWITANTSTSTSAAANPASQPGAAALIASTLVPSGRFLDDNDSAFVADVEWFDAREITKGCNPPDNTLFCPENAVTRGQMAAFLVRALNLTDQGGGNTFVDDDGSIFESDIAKLAAAGITKGCNPPANDLFCPDLRVTREQMAAFLVRALGYKDDGGGDLFKDDDSSVFASDIDRLATAGVTRGCNPPTNDQFCPTDYVTRAQMAAFLHRALG